MSKKEKRQNSKVPKFDLVRNIRDISLDFALGIFLRGIVAEPHKWCGTDFLDLASLDPLWNTPSWDIKNGILEKIFLHSGGLAQLIF